MQPSTVPGSAASRRDAERLSLASLLSYGAGDLTVAIRNASVLNFLLFFYTNVVLLSPSLAGLALALGRVWDGLNDPIVGYVSDSTRSRFGRRRPYILASSLPLALCFFLLWSPPPGLGSSGNFLFLLLTYLIMDVWFTLYATPYLALGAELSRDYDERTRVVTVRALFHGIGTVVAVVALAAAAGGSPAPVPSEAAAAASVPPEELRSRFAGVAALLGMIVALSGVVAFFGSRERAPEGSAGRVSFRAFLSSLTGPVGNRPFRVVLATFAVMTLGGALHQPLIVYVFRDWLRMGEELPVVMLFYLVSTMLSLGVWTRLALRLGKDRAFRGCILWSVTMLSLFPFIPADAPRWIFYAFVVLAGFGAGGYVLPTSMAADVIDHDELHSGKRREGAFFGLWTLAMKLVAAVAIAIVGVALDLIGYVPNRPQTQATLWGLRILYGPVPALFLLASFFVFLRYPLTREAHADVRRRLDSRRSHAGNA